MSETAPITTVAPIDLSSSAGKVTVVATEPPKSSSAASSASSVPVTQTVGAAATAAPIIVVKQQEPCKPYSGTSNPKDYRQYFDRVALLNGWTTNEDKFQHLSVALEGSAVELLKDLPDQGTNIPIFGPLWNAALVI